VCKYDDGDDDRWVDGWMDAIVGRSDRVGVGVFVVVIGGSSVDRWMGFWGGDRIGRVGCSDARTIADVVFLCVVYIS